MLCPSPQDKTLDHYVVLHGIAQLLFWSAFYYLLPALATLIVSETDWSVLHISSTYTLAFLMWALCAPLIGAWIDKGYGAKVIRTGSIMGVVLLVGLSQVTDKWMFSGFVVLLGGCMAATLYDPCFAMIMQRLKQRGSNAVATVTLIAGFATLLTFPLVITLSSGLNWQHIVLVFAALALIGVVLLPDDARTVTKTSQPKEKIPFEKGPVLIAFSFGLVMLGHSILLFLLPVALVGAQGDTNLALLALAILGPAQIAGRIAWKFFNPAISLQNRAVIMFAFLCVPASLLLIFGVTASVVYAALIVQGACYGVHTILRPSLAQLYLRPAHLGRGIGTIAMVGLIMMAIGPTIGGVIWTFTGISGLMSAVLGVNMVALVLGVKLRATTVKGVIT